MSIWNYAKRLSTTNPYIWSLMWRSACELPFLLPHDKSYRALAHFSDQPQGLFLDVGANNGISALSFRRLNLNYDILSLEPNPLHEPALARVQKKIPRFEYKVIGAGQSRSKRIFYTPRYGSVVLHTFTSTDRQQVIRAVAESFGSSVGSSVEIIPATWTIVPIDDLNVSPNIIKVDVEGLDTEVLLGAEKTIERSRPYIMVEACHVGISAFERFMQQHKYDLLGYEVSDDRFHRLSLQSGNWAVDSNNVFLVPAEESENFLA